MSKRLYQRHIPLFIVSAIATAYIAEYFLPTNDALSSIVDEFSLWGTTVFSLVTLYGFTSLTLLMIRRLQERRTFKYTLGSAVTLGTAIVFLLMGLVLPGGVSGETFGLLYLYIVMYAGGGQNASWIHHPYNAFRYFRFTSIESIVMFVAWLGLVLRELSVFVAIFPPFYDIGTWIEAVPNTAVHRVILATSGVSACILGIRAILGKEPGLIEAEVI